MRIRWMYPPACSTGSGPSGRAFRALSSLRSLSATRLHLPEIQRQTSPIHYVVGPLDELSVTGEIHVSQGVIDVPEPQNMQRATRLDDPMLAGVYEGLGIPDALRPRNRLLENTTLDVWVWVARDTWLRNTVMNVEVYTPGDIDALHVTIDPETYEFVLDGVIHADRGDYTFAGREFKLTTGSVTFLSEQKDPFLQLSARHEVPRRGREALTVLVSIGGTLSEPRLTLSSNVEPPIAESDLLSYLAFGSESSSLLTGEGSGVIGDALGGLGIIAEQQLAGLGLGALTQAVFSNLESEGMKAGLDVFRVRPRALPDELNFTGYFQNLVRSVDIQAGEYLTPKLFVAIQGQVGGGVIPGARVEYLTETGISWITTWEPRFLPTIPSLEEAMARRTRVFGSFLQWSKRF
ncbi:MAG: hypothetical protein EXR95_11245 [Gemmatimonadetes bacterium]|nr:hypothetical protein [Gemmatimonadota bacterium]